MKTFAAWIMRGPAQAAALMAVALILGMAIPPFAWLSSAMLALVVLSAGAGGAARVVPPAFVVVALAGWLLIGSPQAGALAAAATWLPILLVAGALRATARLEYALFAAAAVGWAVVLAIQLALPDPAAVWAEWMREFIDATVELGAQVDAAALDDVVARLAPLMTGLMAASVVVSAVTALLVGRWWQAALYNPGGLRREFHGLQLGRTGGLVTAGLMGLAALTGIPAVFGLALVAAAVYLFQGLAVVHGLVAARGLHVAWLVGVYALLLVLFVQTAVALASLGIVDAWADLRRRGSGPPASG